MSFFDKVKRFFVRLFMGKKVEEEIITKEVDEEVSDSVSTSAEAANDVETKDISTEKEESSSVDGNPVFACFTDSDKDGIIDILRPIIKGFNSDALYVNLCTLLEENKVLKTFTTLSEDKMTLTIKFTQNALFNNKIGEYIAEHVVSTFQSNIDAAALGQYVVSADSDAGTIEIKKVG